MKVGSLKLDATTRGFGFAAATVALFSFMVLWVPNMDHVGANGQRGSTYLAIGLVLALALLGATLSRRLVLLTGAMIFTAVGPWGPEHWFQILFALGAAFLVFKCVLGARRRAAESA